MINNEIKNYFLVKNKKIYHNFFIEKKIISGLILQGWEVKSIRAKKIDLSNSYVKICYGEFFLCNYEIQRLSFSTNLNCIRSNKNIKLLLKKNEILFLKNVYNNRKKYTIVPLSLFLKNQWIKLNIAVVTGKTKMDKRESEQKKDWMIQKNKIIKKTMIKF